MAGISIHLNPPQNNSKATEFFLFDCLKGGTKNPLLHPHFFASGCNPFGSWVLYFGSLWCLTYKYIDIGPILMKPIPIERYHWDLSIGTGFIKSGSSWRNLWGKDFHTLQWGNIKWVLTRWIRTSPKINSDRMRFIFIGCYIKIMSPIFWRAIFWWGNIRKKCCPLLANRREK